MTEIIQKKLYNGKVIIDFYPNSHFYKVNGNKVISVTGITGVIDKSRALIYWAVGLTRDYLLEKLEAGEIINSDYILEASKQHQVYSKEATDIGTMVHDWAEQFAKAKLNKTDLPKIKKDMPKEVIQGINAFLDWYNTNKVKFIEVERLIYSKRYKYAGFFDALAKVNGKLSLIDYKTSKGIYNEYKLQLAGYRLALEEETKINIDKNIILNFSKETGEFTDYICDNYQEDKKAFLGALAVKNYLINNK